MMYVCQSAYATSSFKITDGIVAGGGSVHSIEEYSIPLSQNCTLVYEEVVTKENLYQAWIDFIRGKRKRNDVNMFALRLADNIAELHNNLVGGTYTHGAYEEYMVYDPKKRIIHKASVRDRLVHRLLYNALYPYFDTRFFPSSYSCRVGKGTHKARVQFRAYANIVSQNYTKQCNVLKFDIKKCFESIDQGILKRLLSVHIEDKKILSLIETIIDSFEKGLPLGNLTSQLCINIYLHELDYLVKQILGAKYYIRYADDVIIVHESKEYLKKTFASINQFLSKQLFLTAHKIHIQSLYGGVDVLGEVFFPKYARLRRSTERRRKKREKFSI